MTKPKEIELTPAAGSGLGRQLAADLLARPDCVKLLADAFMDGLTATAKYWNKELKMWVPEPDYKTRLAAAQAIISNIEGEPIKRVQVHQITTEPSAKDAKAIERLTASPALQGALQRQLDRARRNTPAGVDTVDLDQ